MRVMTSTVSVKLMNSRPLLRSKWYVSTSGGVVSLVKFLTILPSSFEIATNEFPPISCNVVLPALRYTLFSDVAKSRNFLISLRSYQEIVIFTTAESSS